MRGSDYHFVAWGIAGWVPIAGVFSIDINRRAGHARLRSSHLMTGRFSGSPGMIVGENPGPVAHPAGDSRDVAGAQPTRPTVGSWSGARRSVYLFLQASRSLARA